VSTPMATAQRVRLSLAATASAASVALIVRLALRVARFNHVMATVRWLAGTTHRDATPGEVLHVLHAVDAAATWVPVRIACVERSLTAVVLLAARRRGVTWQLGVRTPPVGRARVALRCHRRANLQAVDDSGLPAADHGFGAIPSNRSMT
jgi:hypothetical protein